MNDVDHTGPTGDDVVVAEIDASLTHDLRRRVLRVGTPSTALEWEGDDEPTTVHLGTFRTSTGSGDRLTDDRCTGVGVAGRPTAIATWLVRPSPDVTGGDAPLIGVQLRGMATDPTVRGRGHGARLLEAGVEWARQLGADHVWANARSPVLGFYVAHGFDIVSEEFDSADTAIPHRRILLRFDRNG